ncbi:hypothetical protein DL240_15445 [Lujinxingia litoralis]|uniref:Glycosyltransferase RgtA/B/C/D-like domain-containing protein n=1 Tax=Lujinxingia litoralis TaxID=2211119 RepID=A0A328C277_9DELT|nr:hypothetical protein [Lujinxingia litoralis]RAL20710.1 hypothetical protein DL240_15445 [Lujinxingia litoralis]
MNEVFACTILIFCGVFVLFVGQTRLPQDDRRFVWLSFWAHVIAAFVLIVLTYEFFGRGDMEVYYGYGEALADYIRVDPLRWGPEVLRLILQQPAEIPMELFGMEGTSTTTMIGITAFLLILTGSSMFGCGLILSFVSFSGQMAMYRAFSAHVGPELRVQVLVATLLVPSAVFWTSGVVKEAVAMGGLGWMIYGMHRLLSGRGKGWALMWLAAGAVAVAVVKSYILFPMVAAGGVWWYWRRSLATSGSVAIAKKPMQLAALGAVAVGGMIGLGQLFPQYSLDSLAEETANLQYQGERIQGGSSYSMGDGATTSLGGQLMFAPVAITASLFRPFLFEAHNAVAAINAVETTLVLFLWVRIFWNRGARGAWRALRASPAMMFCVVFVLLFGLGVGLATTNLGTLSRYRVPMMPMYLLVLLILSARDWRLRAGLMPGPGPSPTTGPGSGERAGTGTDDYRRGARWRGR